MHENSTPRQRALRAALCGACAALLVVNPIAAGVAMAKPKGIKVVRGKVKVRHKGDRTIIRASDKSIIRFKSFDIAKGETVRFVQPGRKASVLGRIKGGGRASQIDGSLLANGRVYLVNKAGVHVGRGAVVDVAALYAIGGEISDRDFVAGVDRFSDLTGAVSNAGTIEADEAHLIGRYVENQGVILADRGVVTMVAGDEVWLRRHADRVMVKIASSDLREQGGVGVDNAGRIEADSGQLVLAAGDLYSLAVRHSGSARARDVRVEGVAGGPVEVTGEIDASGSTPGETGGRVRILGEEVVVAGATVDASGPAGGGRILIGGNREGAGPERNSTRTVVTGDSLVSADATDSGDGGVVIVFADGDAFVYGDLSARGRGEGGAGGFIETSGKRYLEVGSVPDAGSDAGVGGEWLIDPFSLEIVAGAGQNNVDDTDPTVFESDGAASTLGADLVVTALQNNASVTVQTGAGGGGAGDLTVSAGIDYDGAGFVTDGGGRTTLSLRSHGDLEVNAPITDGDTGSVDVLDVVLVSNTDGVMGGDVTLADTIETNGGDLTTTGRDFVLAPTGSVDTGAGAISITATRDIEIPGDLTGGGGLTLDAGGSVDLTGAGDQTLSGGLGSLTTPNDLVKATGNLTLSGGGPMPVLLTKDSAADQVIEATTGQLLLTDAVSKTGEGTLRAAGATIAVGSDVVGTGSPGSNGVVFETDVVLDGAGVEQVLDGGAGNLRLRGDVTKAVSGGFAVTSGDEVRLNRVGGGDQLLDAGPGGLRVGADLVKLTSGKATLAAGAGQTLELAGSATGFTGGAPGLRFDAETVGLTGAAAQSLDAGDGALELAGDVVKTAPGASGGFSLAAGSGVVFDPLIDQSLDSGNGDLVTALDLVKTGGRQLRIGGDRLVLDADDPAGQVVRSEGALVLDTSVEKPSGRAGQITLDGATLSLAGGISGSDDATDNGIVVSTDLVLTGAVDQVLDSKAGVLRVPGDITKTGPGAAGGFQILGTGGLALTQAPAIPVVLDAGTGELRIEPDVVRADGSTGGLVLGGDGAVVLVGDAGGGSQTVDAKDGVLTLSDRVVKQATGALVLDGSEILLQGASIVGTAETTGATGVTLGSRLRLERAGQQLVDARSGALLAVADIEKTAGSGGFQLAGDGGIELAGAGDRALRAAGQRIQIEGSLAKTGAGLLTVDSGDVVLFGDVDGSADAVANGVRFTGDAFFAEPGTLQTLDAGTGRLLLAGDVAKSDGGAPVPGDFALEAGGGLVLDGAGAQSIGASIGTARIGSAGAPLTVQKTTPGVLTLGGDVVALSADALAEGLIVSASTTRLAGNAAQRLDAGTGTLTVLGDVSKTGAGGDTTLTAAGGLTLASNRAQRLDAGAGRLVTDLDIVKSGSDMLTLAAQAGIALVRNDAVSGQQISAGGVLRLEDGVTKTGAGDLTLAGSSVELLGGATGSDVGGNLRIASEATLVGSALHRLDARSGDLLLDGNIDGGGSSGDLELVASGAVVLPSGTAQTLDAGGGALRAEADLVKTGDLTLGGAGGIAFVRSDGSGQQASATGTLRIDDDIAKSGDGALTLAAPAIELGGSVTGTGSAVSNGVTLAGDVDLVGAALQSLDGGAGTLALDGNVVKSGAGGFSVAGAEGVVVDGVADQRLDAGTGTLVVAGDLARNAGSSLSLAGASVDVSSDIDVRAGSLRVEDRLDTLGDITAASGIRFDGEVTIASAPGAATVDAGTGALDARQRITRTGGAGLVLGGDAGVTLAGPIDVVQGDLTVQDALTAGDTVVVAGAAVFAGDGEFAGGLTANDGIRFDGDAVFSSAGDEVIDAGAGVFRAAGDVGKTSAGRLELAGNSVEVDGDVSSLAGLRFAGPVVASGTGNRTLDAGDGALELSSLARAAGSSLTLAGASGVLATGSIDVSSGDLAVANAFTGSRVDVAAGAADFASTAVLAGDLSAEGASFGSALLLNAPAAQTVSAGSGRLDAAAGIAKTGALGLTLAGDGGVSVGGDLDVVPAGASLDVVGDLELTQAGDSVLASGGVVRVMGNVVKTNDGSLTLSSGADPATEAVVLVSGDIEAPGALDFESRSDVDGNVTATGLLSVDAPGSRFGGNLSSSEKLQFTSKIVLDGSGRQKLSSDGKIVAGDITKSTSGDLDLFAEDTIKLDSQVKARGTITLRGRGEDIDKGRVPTRATVFNKQGDLRILSERGDVVADELQKIVAPKGSLEIQARDGSVRVGDLAALETVRVDSPDIEMVARSAGRLLNFEGEKLDDQGVDVVGDRIVYTSEPDADGLVTFATPSGDRVSGSLKDFTVRTLEEGEILAEFFVFEEKILDLRATGPIRTNLGGLIAAEAASVLTEQTELLQSLNQVAVSAKPLWASEVVAFLECGLFDADDPDLPPECAGFEEEASIEGEDARFQSASAQAALDSYKFIFNRVDDIRDSFEMAAEDYRASSGEPVRDGAAFRRYLEQSGGHGDVLGYMGRIGSLFQQMESMGLGGDDFQEARELLLDEIAPGDMDALDLDEAIRGANPEEPPNREAGRSLIAMDEIPGMERWLQ